MTNAIAIAITIATLKSCREGLDRGHVIFLCNAPFWLHFFWKSLQSMFRFLAEFEANYLCRLIMEIKKLDSAFLFNSYMYIYFL
jgi:hypothetical protein